MVRMEIAWRSIRTASSTIATIRNERCVGGEAPESWR
jgi:hypothetical protein